MKKDISEVYDIITVGLELCADIMSRMVQLKEDLNKDLREMTDTLKRLEVCSCGVGYKEPRYGDICAKCFDKEYKEFIKGTLK